MEEKIIFAGALDDHRLCFLKYNPYTKHNIVNYTVQVGCMGPTNLFPLYQTISLETWPQRLKKLRIYPHPFYSHGNYYYLQVIDESLEFDYTNLTQITMDKHDAEYLSAMCEEDRLEREQELNIEWIFDTTSSTIKNFNNLIEWFKENK